MIAAVWETVPDRAAHYLGLLSQAVGVPPLKVFAERRGVLACWDLQPEGVLYESSSAVYSGSLAEPVRCRSLTDATANRGEFAFAALTDRGVLVGRGARIGRPIYFAPVDGRAVVACNRLLPLVRVARKRSLHRNAVARWLALDSGPNLGETGYEQVFQLLPRQLGIWGPSGWVERRDMAVDNSSVALSADEGAEVLRCAILQAVAKACDGKSVAVMLSGGLDSSAVLAGVLAHDRGAARRDVDAVTMSFAGPGDDRPYVTSLCDELGIVPLRVSPESAASDTLAALVVDGAPTLSPLAALEFRAIRLAAERGAQVVLTGVGGDELFTGDARALAHAWKARGIRASIRAARDVAIHRKMGGANRIFSFLLRPHLGPLVPPFVNRWRRRARLHRSSSWLSPLGRALLLQARPRRFEWEGPFTIESVVAGCESYFVDGAQYAQQTAIATGCRREDPLLSSEVLDAVGQVPLSMLLQGDDIRGLYRRALRGLVPENIRLRRSKAGTDDAMGILIRGANRVALSDLARLTLLAEQGLVNSSEFASGFRNALALGPETQGRRWHDYWFPIGAEAFVRHAVENGIAFA